MSPKLDVESNRSEYPEIIIYEDVTKITISCTEKYSEYRDMTKMTKTLNIQDEDAS